jgi:predicted nucleic-acid-binding Zn-ribbon protein
MEHQQLCPNCCTSLDDHNNVLFTEESQIFKGHNHYMMCKNCGYVMIYNKDRDLIFNIDKYQEDKEVLEEIEQLISSIDSHYTLNLEEEVKEEIPPRPVCDGSCNSCQGCVIEEPKQEVVEESPVQEQQPKFNPVLLKNTLLLVHNNTGDAQLVLIDDLSSINNLGEYSVFLLEEAILEPVITFKIHKK